MSRSIRLVLISAFVCTGLAGCDTARSLNPFSEKDKILPGERSPVFPPGDPFAGPRRLPSPNAETESITIPADQQPAR
ncbi:hypothetical protein [Terrihabitans sp. B22-R8]|uniref:hypothetical protein n=1 Tax=Terrihabitans sp. B22-R8 TaxID=3425128 RepID=UPI00403C01CF